MVSGSRRESLRRWDAQQPMAESDVAAAVGRGHRRRRRWLAVRALVAVLLTAALLVAVEALHRADHSTARRTEAIPTTGHTAGSGATGRPSGHLVLTPSHDITRARVTSTPPAAPVAVLRVEPRSGPAPLVVTLDASGSHPAAGARVVSYRFSFGDGTTGGPQPSPATKHGYATAGTFAIALTITDSTGATATTTRPVVVTDAVTDTGSKGSAGLPPSPSPGASKSPPGTSAPDDAVVGEQVAGR